MLLIQLTSREANLLLLYLFFRGAQILKEKIETRMNNVQREETYLIRKVL